MIKLKILIKVHKAYKTPTLIFCCSHTSFVSMFVFEISLALHYFRLRPFFCLKSFPNYLLLMLHVLAKCYFLRDAFHWFHNLNEWPCFSFSLYPLTSFLVLSQFIIICVLMWLFTQYMFPLLATYHQCLTNSRHSRN